ncbi:ParA family protein [Candidatus Chloroploca asiatica]|uniref:Sporulation initiation inhibitor Soj n=1 Tax=Candidatus Chloroploca asiatica TaxID=1506545 RepID=A0A2H3L105_9CHLR|nr:ParA family protein [Candidatus Chloroploca asiatica]PDV96827.1 sporulation initiation inhibitor Soj [Candidatus Chloroploca asiatica]
MTVLAVAMQKGGVGKTTTALSVGVELAQAGARVLLIDLDPQSNLTQALGYDPTEIEHSVYEVLLNPTLGTSFATITTNYGVDLIPATLALAGAELTLAGRFGRELLLRTAIEETRRAYDYILVDSPPSLGVFTVNALTAADAVLVPLQAHVFALKAMPQLEETIGIVRQLNPSLRIGGIAVTMVDRRTSVNAVVEEAIRAQYGELVFQTVIPFNVKLVESPASGQPISIYATESSGAQAYRQLAQEVAARYGKR